MCARLTIAALCLAAGLCGQAFGKDLDFGAPATVTATQSSTGGGARLPSRSWREGAPAIPEIAGDISQTAWRIDTPATTREIEDLLAAQLTRTGWRIEYSCETQACGGFDFRYSLPLFTEPDMHVDLGDFRYLLARREGAVRALVISRAQSAAFVQLIEVGQPAIAAPGTAPPAAVMAGPSDPARPADDDVGEQLRSTGSLVLEDLDFPSGARDLAAGDYASLRALAGFMQANPSARIALVGHTDATGGLAGNIAVSKARAESVRAALIGLGLAPGRIEAEGVGYLAPRASNQNAEGQARNRRVEVLLTTTP